VLSGTKDSNKYGVPTNKKGLSNWYKHYAEQGTLRGPGVAARTVQEGKSGAGKVVPAHTVFSEKAMVTGVKVRALLRPIRPRPAPLTLATPAVVVTAEMLCQTHGHGVPHGRRDRHPLQLPDGPGEAARRHARSREGRRPLKRARTGEDQAQCA
jgi:hypothetical protein